MFITENYSNAIMLAKEHAKRDWPNESCGAILHNGRYVEFKNIAKQPTVSFNCGLERDALFATGQIAAMVHSHCYDKNKIQTTSVPSDFGPSKHDMVNQLTDGIPWGIIATNGDVSSECVFWGDGIPKVELRNRGFRHGPTGTDGKGDCYALIKDYYEQELNIILPEGPRDVEWWNNEENLYFDNMKRAGFYEIEAKDAKPGDVFFAQILANVANHGGILLEGGLILHHLAGRFSRTDSLLRWRSSIVKWIRHEKRNY